MRYIKLLIIILIVYLRHPYLLFSFIKELFNKSFINKAYDQDKSEEYLSKGYVSFELTNKEISYLISYKKIINTLIVLNKLYFFKDIITDNKYYLFTNTNYIYHQFFFPKLESLINFKLNRTIKNLLGKNYFISSFLWQRNLNIPEDVSKETYSNYWHYDFRRHKKKWCRLMIYLTDQDINESIHLFDQKISKIFLEKKLYGRYNNKNLPIFIKNFKFLTNSGPIGTLKLINTGKY